MTGGRSSRGSQASAVREYMRKSVDRAADLSVPEQDVGKKGGAGLFVIRIALAVTCVLVYTFQPTLNEFGQVKSLPGQQTKIKAGLKENHFGAGNNKVEQEAGAQVVRWQVKPASLDDKSKSVKGVPVYEMKAGKIVTEVKDDKMVEKVQYEYVLVDRPPKDVLNGYTYNTNTCYTLQVIGEFLVALALTFFYEGGKALGMIFNFSTMKKLTTVCMVAACAYSLEALAGLGGALLYAVLNQLKLIITAVLMLVVLGTNQSLVAWALLFSATFACLTFAFIQKGLTQGDIYAQRDLAQANWQKEMVLDANGDAFNFPKDPETGSMIEKFSMMWICFFLFAKVFCSCLSTVLMEKAFKGVGNDANAAPVPFYVTVAQFKIMVLPFMIFQWVLVWISGKIMDGEWQTFYEDNPSQVYDSMDFFAGWDTATPWLLLTVLIAKNYCVNLMLKVLSSLVKTFCEQAAMCMILGINLYQQKFKFDDKMMPMGFAMAAILIAVGAYTANKQAEKVAKEMAQRLPSSDEESKPLIKGEAK